MSIFSFLLFFLDPDSSIIKYKIKPDWNEMTATIYIQNCSCYRRHNQIDYLNFTGCYQFRLFHQQNSRTLLLLTVLLKVVQQFVICLLY